MVDRIGSEANAKRISAIDQCFGNTKQPLNIPNRVLVGEGILTKICRKKPKSRQFFLFSDILVYANIIIARKKYNKQHIIPLENVRLQHAANDGELRNGWQIISPMKSFTVYAATPMEKNDWMSHIAKCIRDLLAKKGLPCTEIDASPIWVPDQEAPICMHCKKTEFTVINRRHHCRKCGMVCCGSCTDKRFLLPNQSSKPLRVCHTCYNDLIIQSLIKSPAAGRNNSDSSNDDEEDSDFDDSSSGDQQQQKTTFYGEHI